MSMFCYQCQETAGNKACTARGVCGKSDETSNLMDLLIYTLKGNALLAETLPAGELKNRAGHFAARALFQTITNANFDSDRIRGTIREALELRRELKREGGHSSHNSAVWESAEESWPQEAAAVGVMQEPDQDKRSLKELIIYGLKGISAYASHAQALGYEDHALWSFIHTALASTTRDLAVEELTALTLKTGEHAVTVMALLDKANTETYGNPEMTQVNIGVGKNPGILISGHDLKDMEELLKQSQGSGVDIYTHSEMLPAHYYPAFKKYDHFAGNYGNAWWKQNKEFASFNGPILMTTNCITPVQSGYKDRIYTTGEAGYPGIPHITGDSSGKKDFTPLIEQAKACPPPVELESGSITGGFAHAQVMALADKVVEAVKSGAVKRFVVMAGCDGRQKGRSYFTDVAEQLPENTIILTAGCAKYRYNKLQLGDIGGIPRVLDAGQCNDSYSLAVIALKLKEVFALEDINELPLSFDIAWYEQKAVAVLLALLHLGVKDIRLGPTLPAFLSPNVTQVLVDNFNIKPTGEAAADIEAMMAGA